MKRIQNIVVLLCTLAPLRADIQLRGVLQVDTGYLLALADSEEKAAPRWVRVGGAFRDYTVQSYDPAREIAHLRKKDVTIEAKLVTSHVKRDGEAPVDIRTLSDEELVLL